MFCLEFLNKLREDELALILTQIAPRSRILEIGGGTGAQAAALDRMGHRVVSIDVPSSPYRDSRVFPIVDYDGHSLPFPNGSFDVVMSSNVLEHISDLDAALMEFARVLVPGGRQVHLMPSGVWRFWTTVTGYLELISRLTELGWKTFPKLASKHAAGAILSGIKQAIRLCFSYGVPRRHGERGNVFTELYSFSRLAWTRYFQSRGLAVEEVQAGGLFYTGYMWLGERLPLSMRRRLARIFGSACVLYRIRHDGEAHEL